MSNNFIQYTMQNNETQQFAKFFIKDLKSKRSKFQNKNSTTDFNSSSSN